MKYAQLKFLQFVKQKPFFTNGTDIDFKFVHPEKAYVPNVVASGIYASSRAVQLWKALEPFIMVSFGKLTLFKLVQLIKGAFPLILVTSGKLASDRLVHLPNAPAPIYSQAGKETEVNPVALQNVDAARDVTAGKFAVCKAVLLLKKLYGKIVEIVLL